MKSKHSLSEGNCKCKVGNYHLVNDNKIVCKDGNKLLVHTCTLCKSTIYKCIAYRTNWNLYSNCYSTDRYRQKQHTIVKGAKYNKVNDIDGINLNEEIDKKISLSNGFNNINNKELIEMKFISNLHNETIN